MEASANGGSLYCDRRQVQNRPTNSNNHTVRVEIGDHEATVGQDLHADGRSAALRD